MPVLGLNELVARAVRKAEAGLGNNENSLAAASVVWEAVGRFCEQTMAEGKGVLVRDVGCLTYRVTELGDGKLKREAVFLLHPKMKALHSASCGKNTEFPRDENASLFDQRPFVPMVPLNVNTIAYLSGQPGPLARGIVDAVIVNFIEAVRSAEDVDLDFRVARLSVRNKRVSAAFRVEADADYKPKTGQIMTCTARGGRLSEYWDDRNATMRSAVAANDFTSNFLSTVNRTSLRGVPARK